MDAGRNEFTFFWFIENYSYCRHKTGERLVSPPFTAGGPEGTAWDLRLYPRGESDEDKGHISLFLGRSAEDDGSENISIKYELSFLAADGSALRSAEHDNMFKKGAGYGFLKFLKMDDILLRRNANYLPPHTLTVRCKIWKGEGRVHKVAPICARTRIGIETVSFMHAVEDFSTLEPNQKHTIEIRSHSKEECFALSSLYFTYDSCSEGEMVVEITPSDSNHILSERKISLLGSGTIIHYGGDDNRFDVERKDIQKLPLSLTRQLILNRKSDYLPDGKLSLVCECVFSTGLEIGKIEGTRHEMPVESTKQTNNQKLLILFLIIAFTYFMWF